MAKKKNANEELIESLLKRDGNIRCEKCSLPNWDVWHKPGPCPSDAASAALKEAAPRMATIKL